MNPFKVTKFYEVDSFKEEFFSDLYENDYNVNRNFIFRFGKRLDTFLSIKTVLFWKPMSVRKNKTF